MALTLIASVQSEEIEPLRDPTRPLLSVADKKRAQIKLQAIMTRNGQRQAIVNGVVLNPGDIYKSHKVIEILPSSVLIEFDGKRREIALRPNIVNVGKK